MSATTPPNHLGTNVPSSALNEKKEYGASEKKPVIEDEEEDEDMDALIEELESQDQNIEDDDEEEAVAGSARTIPEDQLQTSTRDGLSSSEVIARRKKYGLNQMKEEKENLILKFLGFFIGPIQFVMEAAAVLAGKILLSGIPTAVQVVRPNLDGKMTWHPQVFQSKDLAAPADELKPPTFNCGQSLTHF